MWLNEFKQDVEQRLLHFLWRQWGQLGLASASVDTRDHWVIDPEALWLFSSSLARYDARLFDEIMDWLVKNSAFLNLPRLKSLHRKFSLGELDVTAAMADVICQHNSRLHWRFNVPEPDGELQALFISEDMKPLGFGAQDETFLRYGFTRGAVELRGLSRRFNRVMPECNLLRLRSIFGVSARAEIVLYLLTHKLGHPSQIAKETGFSQKNIQDTMVDMSASGFIHPGQLDGRKKSYFIQDQAAPLLVAGSGKPVQWVTWPPLFGALEILLSGLKVLQNEAISQNLIASELKQLVHLMRPGFQQAGFADVMSDPLPHHGVAYLPVFNSDVEKLLIRINA